MKYNATSQAPFLKAIHHRFLSFLFKFELVIFFIFLNSHFTTFSQSEQNAFFQRMTDIDGLPNNNTLSILKDKRGYLWVGTSEGIAKYNGYSFTVFQEEANDNSLARNTIICMAEDQQGNIWIGHDEGYVSRLNIYTHEIQQFKISEKSVMTVLTIYCDRSGKLWFTVEEDGLYLFEQNKFRFIGTLPDLPQNHERGQKYFASIVKIYEDQQGIFWLATRNGLCSFNPSTLEFDQIDPLSRVNDSEEPGSPTSILADNSGKLWIATYGDGIISYDIKQKSWEKFLFQSGRPETSNIVYHLTWKDSDEIWVPSIGSGLFSFNINTKKYTRFKTNFDDIIDNPFFGSILKDDQNIVWITSDKGLYKLDPRENQFDFIQVPVAKSFFSHYYSVSGVLFNQANGDTVISTTFADGLHFTRRGRHRLISNFDVHPEQEKFLLINDILYDQDGVLWVLTRDYLYFLDKNLNPIKTSCTDNFKLLKDPPLLRRFIKTQNGQLWISTHSHGVLIYDPRNNQTTHLTHEVGLTISKTRGLQEDNAGNVWVIHPDNAISIVNKEDHSTKHLNLTSDQESEHYKLNEIAMTDDGSMWIATNKGLIEYTHGHFKNWGKTSGLPSNNIHSIVSDRDAVWFLTSNGLVYLNKSTNTLKSFNSIDGLRNNFMWLKLRKDHFDNIFLVTFHGYYHLNKSNLLNTSAQKVPLVLTQLKVLDSPIQTSDSLDKVSLKYRTNAVSIEFAALNYLHESKNSYSYMLQGLDKQWSIPSKSHIVNYRSLPPGDYQFKVRLMNGNTEATMLSIHIDKPIWLDWWFIGGCSLILILSVHSIYRYRVYQVVKNVKLKNEFNKALAEVEMKALKAQMNPHFIFNCLNSINRYILKADRIEASTYLTKFSKLIRLILENSNAKIVPLDLEINALKLYLDLESMRFNSKFEYIFHIDNMLNPSVIGIPPMMIQPYVENAIWHGLLPKGSNGKITLSFKMEDKTLSCEIEDNGVGRKKSSEFKRNKSIEDRRSFGMKINSDRVEMLNHLNYKPSSIQIIDLEDEKGNPSGTRVKLNIQTAEIETNKFYESNNY